MEYCIFRKNLFHKNKYSLHKVHNFKSPNTTLILLIGCQALMYLTENSMVCKDCQYIEISLETPLLSFAKTIFKKFCRIDTIYREIKTLDNEVASINLQKGKDQSPLNNEGEIHSLIGINDSQA